MPFYSYRSASGALRVTAPDIEQTVTITACVLHLLCKLPSLSGQNLDLDVWEFPLQYLEFVLGRKL